MTIIPNYEKFQPRFALYMKANGLSPGDDYKSYEYINWINALATEFKRSIGKRDVDGISPDEQEYFTQYINGVVK
jgi:hypothetical protein